MSNLIPKEALEKAIEGGWNLYPGMTDYPPSQKLQAAAKITFQERIALDPAFWRSLGTALGWFERVGVPYWQIHAHDFYDLVLTGQDPAPFWQSLLVTAE